MRFPLDERSRQAIVEGRAAVAVQVDHPNYQASATLSDNTMRALAADLGDAAAGAV